MNQSIERNRTSMAESDEEYRSHRRNKFDHERGDYGPSREREFLRRDHHKDRSPERNRKEQRRHEKSRSHRKKGHRHHERGHRERDHSYYEKSERPSPPEQDTGFHPPPRRMRTDWGDVGGEPCQRGGDFRDKLEDRGAHHHPPLHPWGPYEASSRLQSHDTFIPHRFGGSPDGAPGRPPTGLQSFKEFLLRLNPAVGEVDAVRCYKEYKMAFSRQQMEAFFLAHRDEEWFRLKYHPEDIERRDAETHDALQKRLDVYMYLRGKGWFDNISLDIQQASAIIKVLDAVQIRFEGGTGNDLRALETPGKGEKERVMEREERGKETPPSEPQKQEEVHTVDAEHRLAPRAERARKRKHIDKVKVSEFNSASVSRPSDQSAEREADRKREKENMLHRELTEKKDQEDDKENRVAMKRRNEETEDRKMEEKMGQGRPEEEKGGAASFPCQLHKTRSLFMRNIPPTIYKEEIVNLCVKYPGFMRVCLSEPHAEYRFFRRCWVTFDHLANIQDICWQLQNVRLREYKLSPVVHRDLCRRVRMANGITQHRTLMQEHISLAAQLIRSLDSRWSVWGGDQDKGNPVLKNVSYHLIEEVSAEEEELTGRVGAAIPQSEVTVERDNGLVKVLDGLLLYLRVVHSVDFYNACQHSTENEMPSCCGSVHVRGPVPPNRVPTLHMLEWQKKFEVKLRLLFWPRETLSEDEVGKLGRKHPAQEVDKFVRANTRELDREKWLCVLCEKKFKGPEFVSKHLLSRHGEQVEEVRKEAAFFNNFLMDPKRPALPEMRSPPPMPSRPGQAGPAFSHQCGWSFNQPSPPFIGYERSPFPPNEYGDGGHFGWFRGVPHRKPQQKRVTHREPRKVTRYCDLDAPDADFF
ncbi:serrate RNA effector molecule homolog isoform X2 [Alosa sapidissima]|uniref:serrate RNA effector molecule homolog isoform X2 n=1 Tax=Alosa sapidissima TaxID=34773 RepID=UPI001C09AFE7|nr:serrate RNA effector molecule homolog isoform X2 [Alosa sapidissima]